MSSLDPKLEVQVVNDEIVVTLPGTNYLVTYYKMIGSSGLMAKRVADTDDPRIPECACPSFSPRRGSSRMTKQENSAGLCKPLAELMVIRSSSASGTKRTTLDTRCSVSF